MRDYGGFEHNMQSLRVVDELEERYADFPGLNLTFETREGILKHCSVINARHLGLLGERFIRRQQPSLEAQISNLADEIAYNNHDVDDGLRAGLISVEDLRSVALFRREHDEVLKAYPDLVGRRQIHEIVRRMINHVVADLIRTSAVAVRAVAPANIDAVRQESKMLIGLSDTVMEEHLELKRYLRETVYKHYRVLRMTTKARKVVQSLFNAFFDAPELMPVEHQRIAANKRSQSNAQGLARAVADYIAGMTDRYAILEHQRVFDPAERS
jgi:dGTPase